MIFRPYKLCKGRWKKLQMCEMKEKWKTKQNYVGCTRYISTVLIHLLSLSLLTYIVIIITIIIIIIILSLEYESWYLIIRICKRLYALYRFVWLEWRGESLTRVIRDTYYAVPLAGGFFRAFRHRSCARETRWQIFNNCYERIQVYDSTIAKGKPKISWTWAKVRSKNFWGAVRTETCKKRVERSYSRIFFGAPRVPL